ncbi:hypothetical protein BB560_004329 [Smittium megazygosporum]|uniref:Uncharacterized protein n=1 Tax=Smittium megazygosporum TaxID=133381 RepID=A0A2T9Z9M4_9FUNG|nr:hypothetical protein BB560_004329 [Smittium megazygosporum]
MYNFRPGISDRCSGIEISNGRFAHKLNKGNKGLSGFGLNSMVMVFKQTLDSMNQVRWKFPSEKTDPDFRENDAIFISKNNDSLSNKALIDPIDPLIVEKFSILKFFEHIAYYSEDYFQKHRLFPDLPVTTVHSLNLHILMSKNTSNFLKTLFENIGSLKYDNHRVQTLTLDGEREFDSENS